MQLGHHCLLHIATFLEPVSTFATSFILVCKDWNKLDKDPLLWYSYCVDFLWCNPQDIPHENIKQFFISTHKRKYFKVAIHLGNEPDNGLQRVGKYGVTIRNPPIRYNFRNIYDDGTPLTEIYDDMAKPVVQKFMQGYHGALIIHRGANQFKTMISPTYDDGVWVQSAQDIFHLISQLGHNDVSLSLSSISLYNEVARDLLKDSKEVRFSEDPQGVITGDYSRLPINTYDDFIRVVKQIDHIRHTEMTLMSMSSLRLTTIFIFFLRNKDTESMLHLVDFPQYHRPVYAAGTQRFLESAYIHKGWIAYSHVVKAVSHLPPYSHVPYRDSKITRVLRHVFNGSAFTSVIVCCKDVPDTSLRFADMAARIPTNPQKNILTTSAK